MEHKFILVDQKTRKKYELVDGVLVGRASNSDISLNDKRVSKSHLKITLTSDGELYIRDLDSSNGTKVNDQTVQSSTDFYIEEGDLIDLGSHRFEVIKVTKSTTRKSTVNNYEIGLVPAIKVAFLVVVLVVLLIIWSIFIVIQGSINLDGSLITLPFKLVPIFLSSLLISWVYLLLVKKLHLDKLEIKKVSLYFTIFSILFSIYFQKKLINPSYKTISFESTPFDHAPKIDIKANAEFVTRLGLSYASFFDLLPLGQFEKEMVRLVKDVAIDGHIALSVNKVFESKRKDHLCKNYNSDYSTCVIDFYKSLQGVYNLGISGEIMMIAAGASVIYEDRKRLEKKHGKKNIYITLKTINSLIEFNIHTIKKLSPLVTDINLGMLNSDKKGIPTNFLEKFIIIKFLETASNKIGGIVDKASAKVQEVENDGSLPRHDDPLFLKTALEIERLHKLEKEFKSLFKKDQLKEKISGFSNWSANPDNQVKLNNKLKSDSIILSTLVYIRPELIYGLIKPNTPPGKE